MSIEFPKGYNYGLGKFYYWCTMKIFTYICTVNARLRHGIKFFNMKEIIINFNFGEGPHKRVEDLPLVLVKNSPIEERSRIIVAEKDVNTTDLVLY